MSGEILPPGAVAEMKKFDAILLGAIGHPDVKPGILEKGILLELRFKLDQYINLRPIKLFPGVETPLKDKGPADIDYVVVRENSGDAYTGSGGVMMKGTPHEVATQTAVYTRHQVDRWYRRHRHHRRALGRLPALFQAQDLLRRQVEEAFDLRQEFAGREAVVDSDGH